MERKMINDQLGFLKLRCCVSDSIKTIRLLWERDLQRIFKLTLLVNAVSHTWQMRPPMETEGVAIRLYKWMSVILNSFSQTQVTS